MKFQKLGGIVILGALALMVSACANLSGTVDPNSVDDNWLAAYGTNPRAVNIAVGAGLLERKEVSLAIAKDARVQRRWEEYHGAWGAAGHAVNVVGEGASYVVGTRYMWKAGDLLDSQSNLADQQARLTGSFADQGAIVTRHSETSKQWIDLDGKVTQTVKGGTHNTVDKNVNVSGGLNNENWVRGGLDNTLEVTGGAHNTLDVTGGTHSTVDHDVSGAVDHNVHGKVRVDGDIDVSGSIDALFQCNMCGNMGGNMGGGGD